MSGSSYCVSGQSRNTRYKIPQQFPCRVVFPCRHIHVIVVQEIDSVEVKEVGEQ
ncbi:hypothetical protein DPMN_046296, partial [Dreissena polymorpha]